MAKQARDNRVPIMMSTEELAEVDNWRFARHIATRSDAIRRAARNGLWVEAEVEQIAEYTEAIYEMVHAKYAELRDWVSWFQDEAASASKKPPLDPLEVLDRVAWWLQGMEREVDILDTQVISLNNRLVSVATAPHERASMLAKRRELREADRRRERFVKREQEFAEQQAMLWAYNSLSQKERAAFMELPDDEAEMFIQERMKEAPEVRPFDRAGLPKSIYEENRERAQERPLDAFRRFVAEDARRAMQDYVGDLEDDDDGEGSEK